MSLKENDKSLLSDPFLNICMYGLNTFKFVDNLL